ncbi:RHS repeat domain-containing protein [Bernardetia sp. OM2101]|uniref:RHS repeat domain-containing protein n=1 Tax=Bernardetia sp. OM2101 TaxID=3344876 RepID=UPI0035CFA1B2
MYFCVFYFIPVIRNLRELNRAKRAKSLEPNSYHVPRGELVLQLRDSTDSLLVEKRQKITISAVTAWQELTADFVAKEEGEVTVFIDNSDIEPVFFDNLELRVERQPTLVITQEHHYYPFGMNLSGIERQGDLMYQFNGMIEKEEAFGLELYETPFRSYDAQLGRFWQVEPLADIYCSISMYQFAYNNPVSFNDPTGLSSDTGSGSGIGGFPLPAQPEPQTGGNVGSGPSDPGRIGGGANIGGSRTRIGGGGYTWELGNNRSSPYSMGGTPGQGPAMIRIVNYECNEDVTKAISIVNDFLEDNGINARVMEFSRSQSLTIDNIQGRNAVYLIGDSKNAKALIKYSNTLAMPGASKVFDKGDREAVESATGWRYQIGEKKLKTITVNPFGGRNTATIGLDKYYTYTGETGPQGYTDIGFRGKNINSAEAIALTILHVMGHNAGIKDLYSGNLGIMTNGGALGSAFKNGASFAEITSMSEENEQNRTWQMFVKSYFNGSGNPASIFNDNNINVHNYKSPAMIDILKVIIYEIIK